MPHIILKTSEIVEQRLRKKIQRLTTQRDHWKSEYDKLSYILRMFPYSTAKDRYEERKNQEANNKRLKELDATQRLLLNENERLKEQVHILTSISGEKD
jgi:hypothetical protein